MRTTCNVLVEIRIEIELKDVVERALLALFLRLERLRVVEDLTIAVAQDIGGVPRPATPIVGALGPGAMTVLMNVCPVFMSLPQTGEPVFAASSCSAGTSALMFGAALP